MADMLSDPGSFQHSAVSVNLVSDQSTRAADCIWTPDSTGRGRTAAHVGSLAAVCNSEALTVSNRKAATQPLQKENQDPIPDSGERSQSHLRFAQQTSSIQTCTATFCMLVTVTRALLST